MTIFWFFVLLLMAVAVFWLAPALLREHRLGELDRNQQNVSIARERLDEMAADHASGAMTEEVFQQARDELEASLVDDVAVLDQDPDEVANSASSKTGKFTLAALAVIVPLSTLGLYNHLGSPQYLDYVGASAGLDTVTPVNPHDSGPPASLDELTARLVERLAENPDDGEGWFLLSKTYMAQERYPEALEALEKSYAIFGDYPAILLGMADAMAMVRDGNLTGEPTEYIDKALQMEPENTTGLWLGGMAAQQNGNFQLAIDRWSKLMPLLGDDPQSRGQVLQLISEAAREASENAVEVSISQPVLATAKALVEQQSGMSDAMPAATTPQPVAEPTEPVVMPTEPVADGPPAIKAWVSIDSALKARADPADTVFVFARASEGPPMPLAAYRTTVAELPMEVTLDDNSAMMPQMKMSLFEQVLVTARVSKSGQPGAAAGDLTSASLPVSVGGTVGVELSIDTIVQ